MKITSYNHHARLLSSRAVGRFAATSLLRSREPTLSCNQFSTFDHSISGLQVTGPELDFRVNRAAFRSSSMLLGDLFLRQRFEFWAALFSRYSVNLAAFCNIVLRSVIDRQSVV